MKLQGEISKVMKFPNPSGHLDTSARNPRLKAMSGKGNITAGKQQHRESEGQFMEIQCDVAIVALIINLYTQE